MSVLNDFFSAIYENEKLKMKTTHINMCNAFEIALRAMMGNSIRDINVVRDVFVYL